MQRFLSSNATDAVPEITSGEHGESDESLLTQAQSLLDITDVCNLPSAAQFRSLQYDAVDAKRKDIRIGGNNCVNDTLPAELRTQTFSFAPSTDDRTPQSLE